MNVLQSFLLAFRSMRKSVFTNCLLTLLLVFSLFMTQLLTASMIGPYAGKITAEKKMDKKLSDWGLIMLDIRQEWNEDVTSYFQKLLGEGIVERIGGYDEAGMRDTGLKDLTEIQNGTSVKQSRNYDDVTLIGYFTDNLSLFAQDCKINQDYVQKSDNKDDILLLLGNSYQDISEGTVYQSDLIAERQYIVIGHMPKNYSFFVDAVYNDDELLNATLINNLDDQVIFVIQGDDYIESQAQLFYVPTGVSEETLTRIRQMADAEGISLSCMKLETSYKRKSERAVEESRYAFPYLLIILISSCVMLISYHLVKIIGNSKRYGIYYTVGCQDSDIFKMMLIENAVRIILSFFVATLTFYQVFRNLYESYNIIVQSQKIIIGAAILSEIVIAFLLLVVGTSIPWVMLKKKSPAQLIRSFD